MDAQLIIVICVLAAAAVIAVVAWLLVRRYRRQHEIFIKFDTEAGPLRIYTIARDDDWVRVMDVQGTLQSATYLEDWRCYELVYDYTKDYNRMFEAHLPIRDVLVLGGGGYSYPKYLISHYPDIRCEVVEIDSMVTAIARRYFFLDRLIAEYDTEESGRLQLICDEARHYLEHCDKRYSAIVNDCFSGLHFAEGLATLEATRLYHEHLMDGGVYLSNVIGALEGDRSKMLQRIVATLSQVFTHVYVIAGQPDIPTNCDNNVIIATDGDWVFSDVFPLVRDLGADVLLDRNTAEVDWVMPIAD